jgi:hypothetical protein
MIQNSMKDSSAGIFRFYPEMEPPSGSEGMTDGCYDEDNDSVLDFVHRDGYCEELEASLPSVVGEIYSLPVYSSAVDEMPFRFEINDIINLSVGAFRLLSA